MNKIAQRRKVLNKIKEKLYTPVETAVGMFSPEFTRLMDTLREVDDEAREHAVDLKDILKVARSNFNRREYMTAISYLGKFHERLELIKNEFSKLSKEATSIHNEFLFGDLDDEHKKYLFEKMPGRFKPKAKKPAAPAVQSADDGLEKEADFKDWWHNLRDDRGKSLKFFEKRFPKTIKEIKRQTEKMLNRSEMFLNVLMSTFKTLAGFRASRKLEEYIKVVDGFNNKYNAYDDAFNDYFNGSVKKFIDSQKEYDLKRAVPATPVAPEEGLGAVMEPEKLPESNKDFKEVLDESPKSFPKPHPNKNVLELVEEPESSEPPTPRNNKFLLEEESPTKTVFDPAKYTPPVGELNVSPTEREMQNIIQVSPSAAPGSPTVLSPTLRSPQMEEYRAQVVPPPEKPQGVYQKPIPKPSKVPQIVTEEGPAEKFQIAPSYPKIPSGILPASSTKINDNDVIPSIAKEFLDKLTKLAGENQLVMATEIIKFAKSIETSNKDVSARLLVIAKNLLK